MPRFDPRVLILAPVIVLAGACTGDAEPTAPAPVTPSAAAPASAPAPASPSAPAPSPSDSVYVEEDDEPTAAPGDLSDEAQSHLDEALGTELGALEQAPADIAVGRRAALDRLPENPSAVLAALKNYPWYSPEARAAYDRAVAAG
jgi:hypothetical protein